MSVGDVNEFVCVVGPFGRKPPTEAATALLDVLLVVFGQEPLDCLLGIR